jgi:hypothetical protein
MQNININIAYTLRLLLVFIRLYDQILMSSCTPLKIFFPVNFNIILHNTLYVNERPRNKGNIGRDRVDRNYSYFESQGFEY